MMSRIKYVHTSRTVSKLLSGSYREKRLSLNASLSLSRNYRLNCAVSFQTGSALPAPHPSYTRDSMKASSKVLTSVNNEIMWKEGAVKNEQESRNLVTGLIE